MPYRGRVVKRVKGQRKMKPLNPTVKFTLTKTYQVSKGATATGNNYYISIDAATPFSPISIKNGDWSDSNTFSNEPVGLNSDLYTHYNHLVVKGCHVSASVVDNVDASAGESETVSLGQLTVIRSSAAGSITSVHTGPELKQLYGQNCRDFTLHAAELSKTALQKSAYCSNGYSAKKTWNTDPNANDDLRVQNLSGSSNTPNDSTFISVCLSPRFQTANYLQPMVVTVRLTYIIQFQEPTIIQSVPLPMNVSGNGYTKRNQTNYEYVKSSAKSMYAQTPSMSQINRAVRQAQDAIFMLNSIKRRQRAIRY